MSLSITDRAQSGLVFDSQLIRRFDVTGPRYTSYPTADRFVEEFNAEVLSSWFGRRAVNNVNPPLSLYVHIPFCDTICAYCACNKIVTKDRARSDEYLKYLTKEIDMRAKLLTGGRMITQLHLGGGTPTYLSQDEMRRLVGVLREHFEFVADGEYSIEVDPRKVDFDTVQLLAELGFNRMSIGVQDFDPDVQRAVNRIQSVEETDEVIKAARVNGFKSISVDLIYGLPKQNIDSFDRTLDRVIALNPDRLSIYNYAHLPRMFKAQRSIVATDLPLADTKLQILALAIQKLTEAGYVYVGMDHFARPDDELAVAQRQGRLHRNFQGYSTHADCDLLAFGVSAISKIGPCYSQNFRVTDEYYRTLDNDVLPVMRGLELTPDDMRRRSIIQALMCHFGLSIKNFESLHRIDFKRYFEPELADLREMEKVSLLEINDQRIAVLPRGRLLVRAIAMVFDRHLRNDQRQVRYSNLI